MAASVNEIRTYIEKVFPGWLPDYAEIPVGMNMQDIQEWLNGDSQYQLSIGSNHSQNAHYELKKFILDNLDRHPNMEQLAHATRLVIPELLYAVGVQKLNTNSGISFPDYVNALAQLITVGWRDHAELHARLGLQELMKHAMQRGDYKGGALGQGISPYSFPYVIMDVMQDWLRAEKTSTETIWRNDLYEKYGGYGGWEELIENWREPDANKFADILYAAAGFHIAQSRDREMIGHDDDPDYVEKFFEVEEDKFWLYPVILFTFLRLREWEGLPNPGHLNHDLFQKGIFRHLPTVPDWPADPFYDAVDARFRAMFPETPSLADLPRLRAEQS